MNKPKNQIIKDYETRFIYLFLSIAIWVTTIIVVIILSTKNLESPALIITILGFFVSMLFFYLGNRCPICDKLKWYDYAEYKYIKLDKFTYKCRNCNLNNKQIRQYVDLLNRNVEINEDNLRKIIKG